MSSNREIGRVLRANTSGFELGCRVKQLDIPAFGGLVKAERDNDETVYGLIYNIHIDDDPLVGQLVLTDNLEAADINDQRQNRVIPIEMSVLAIGYRSRGGIVYGFPPRPPLNLDPVVMVREAVEVTEFTDKLSYLRLILRSAQSGVPIDQLLVAHIRDTHALRGNDSRWAMGAIDELIELLRSEYTTLIPTLEALSEALPELSSI